MKKRAQYLVYIGLFLILISLIQAATFSSEGPTEFVNIEGKTIAYKTIGDGPNVLIAIHGSPGGKENFDTFEGLLPNHTIYALDMIGFGESSMSTNDYGFGQTTYVKGFMDELGIESTDLIGYSWGGLVVTKFAHEYPDQVDHLYVLAGVGVPEGSHTRTHITETARYILTAPLLIIYPGSFASPAFSIGARHGFLRSFFDADQREVREYLPEITVPTTFIHGTQDTVVLPIASERGAELVPNSTLHWFEGGHGTIFSTAEPIIEAMQR